MTPLTRQTQKVFAGNANVDNLAVFGTMKTGTPQYSSNVETLQSTTYSQGWSDAILNDKAPYLEEMNAVQYGLSYQLAYILQEGAFEYDAGTEYSSTSLVKVINGNKLELYHSLQDNNIGNPITNPSYWEKLQLSEGGRYIGEIVASPLPLTDAGLHLLDGTLLSKDGIYNDFVDYIASIYNSSLNCFTTEASWQSAVSQYGSCGKFVYNATNNTVRLPKLTNILQPTNDVSTLGDITPAGLPNITGTVNFSGTDNWADYSGAFANSYTTTGAGRSHNSGQNASQLVIQLNASRSNNIYGNSQTVQPQTVKVFYYIVVATDTKTSIQVDIDNIATDLNGKADIDLDNVPTSKGILKETYINGTSWYRVYSDGWCEQGGNMQTTATVTFLKPFSNANYSVIATLTNGSTANYEPIIVTDKTASGCKINNSYSRRCDWRAYGYIA